MSRPLLTPYFAYRSPVRRTLVILGLVYLVANLASWADAKVVFVYGQVSAGPAGKTPVAKESIIKDNHLVVTASGARVIVYNAQTKQTLNIGPNQSAKLADLFKNRSAQRQKLFVNMRNSTYKQIITTAAVRGSEQGKQSISWADGSAAPVDYSRAWAKFKAGDFTSVFNLTKSAADPEGRLLRALSKVSAGNQEVLDAKERAQAEKDLVFASDKTSDYTLRLAARQALGMYYMERGDFKKAEASFWKLWSGAKPSDIPELVYMQMVQAAQITGQSARVATYLSNLRRFYPGTSYR